MTRSLIVWGCTSGAGKSWLATALCRVAARRGLRVAPFKAQNMSNNARVVPAPDGSLGEIGSAQYFQALAAGAAPRCAMNPVLLKPERDTASQVVVMGRADPALSRMPWRERSERLAGVAEAAFRELAAGVDLVVIEGAGSPAEINLADHDYVNLGAARWAMQAGPTAALLVSDIDRGGSFAHLWGTAALLPADLRPLLQGFVLNRFRGDAALLDPGPAMLEARCGVPVVGVIPMIRDHGLPEEDALFDPRSAAAAVPAGAAGEPVVQVAVLAPPAISNLDEFAPLVRVPGVVLRWARTPAELAGLGADDWIVLPGSKQASGDLAWLRRQGLDAAVTAHAAAGGRVLGICGGVQLLGQTLADPQGHDGEAFEHREALGLLPLATRFEAAKRLVNGPLRFGAAHGAWAALAGVEARGYEIRCGRTEALAASARPVLFDAAGEAIGWQRGPVLGVTAHGLFEQPAVLQALFGAAVPTLDAAFDRLADAVEVHLDRRRLAHWLGA